MTKPYKHRPPGGAGSLDPECEVLCGALNRLPGVRTTAACYANGRLEVFFSVDNLTALPNVVRWFASCHARFGRDWRVDVWQGCESDQLEFIIRGLNLAECRQQSLALAREINRFVDTGCQQWFTVQNRRWLTQLRVGGGKYPGDCRLDRRPTPRLYLPEWEYCISYRHNWNILQF